MEMPAHPGLLVKENCLDGTGLSVTECARILGVTRATLSRILNGRSGISPEMAVRLEMAGWLTAGQWLRMQVRYELEQVRARGDALGVERFVGAGSALE